MRRSCQHAFFHEDMWPYWIGLGNCFIKLANVHYIREMGLKLLLFPLAHFLYDMKPEISTRWLANPSRGYSQFPHNHQSSYGPINHREENS